MGRLLGAAMVAVACALVLTAGSAQVAVDRAGPVTALAADRATAWVTGTVLTEPRLVHRQDGRPDLVVITLRVESVTGRGSTTTVDSPVVVFADLGWSEVRWRSSVSGLGRLGPPDPGGQEVATFTPRSPPQVHGSTGPVLAAADTMRQRLRDSVAPLPEDARGLVPGLVVGDTSLTPADLTDAMAATGMTHLSAVSGSNVAIVLGAVVVLCQLLGLPRRWWPPLALLALVGFVILCRPEPSVLRAGAMGVVGLLAMSASRRRASLPALAAAVLVLLCLDPWLSRSAGFALSALATLGLVVFARPWGAAIGARLPSRCAVLGHAVAIPLAAQVVCAPVIVLLQGSISTVAVLANLLAAPLVAPTTLAGIGAALAGTVWAPAGVALAWLAALPAWLLGRIARWGARAPLGTIDWLDGGAGAWLLALVTVAVLACGPWLLMHARRRPFVCVLAAAAGLAGVLPVPGDHGGWPPPGWVVVGCDVGQGDAFVVRTASGGAVVVDVGPDPDAIAACLGRLGVTRVDGLVLSHFHADHVDGLRGVLDNLPVAAAYLTPVRDPPEVAERVRRDLTDAGVPIAEVWAGDRLQWSDGAVTAEVVWPGRLVRGGSVANNGSVVLDLQVAGTRVLFAGDIEPEAAVSVRRAVAGRDFDVIKVAHHGSAAQDEQLVRDTDAEVAMIGVGKDNTFGHPTPSALRLLGESGAVVLRTDRDGDIAVLRGGQGALEVSSRGPP